MIFDGVRIIENDKMIDVTEDWSKVRSRGRAARRRRQGHRQNIKVIGTPKTEIISIDGGRTLIVHPATAQVLRREIQARAWDTRPGAAW